MITMCFLKRCTLIVLLVSMFLATANAASYTPVYGPQLFTRSTGAPQTITNNFQRCGNSPCQIVVTNGAVNGSNRVSSGSISLNGSPVIGSADFNQKISSIVRPVTLLSQNGLAVTLASKPSSFLSVTLQCMTSSVELSAGAPGISLQPNGSLLSTVNIANKGTVDAKDVTVTAITLNGGTLTSALPSNLGTIPANGSAVLNANFSGGPFVPGQSYALTVEGTYTDGTYSYCFTVNEDLTIPPAAPGSASLGEVSVLPQLTNGPYPPQPLNFPDEVNPEGWTVPNGPITASGIPTPTGTAVQNAPIGDPPEIDFKVNNGLGLTSGGANGQASTVAEPSGGVSGGGVVFVTANWTAAYSTDGIHFTQLNPTTIFPNDAVGFCCDQIVQYVPSIDRFIWLLQGNGYRLAMASPQQIINSHGTSWTYWNLTPQVFGEKVGVSFDYPDLSVGNNDLYLSWDGNGGFQVARVALAALQAAGTIGIGFTHPTDAPMAWGSHLMQDTGDEIFWAGHNNSSNMRIFSLQESSNTYFWRDRNVSSWANNAPTSKTPDGQDWLAKNFNGPGGNSFPRNGVIGATRSGNQLWFAWTAGTNNNFQQAHVEMVRFDRSSDFTKAEQVRNLE